MITARNIMSFLNPLFIGENITSFSLLQDKIKEFPPHTLLPLDFFEASIQFFPDKGELLTSGDWVQIGVGKGGGALFFKAIMEDMKINQKLFLIDTFGFISLSDINKAKDVEFIRQLGLTEQGLSNSDFLDEVESLFKSFNLYENILLIQQDINYYPVEKIPKEIAFLHIDVDFYEATLSALEFFYDSVVPGGIIIIDDYFMELLNCKDAVDYFFQKRQTDLGIHSVKFSSFALLIIKPT